MPIYLTESIIDSRDITDRIEELEELTDVSAHELLPGDTAELTDLQNELAALEDVRAQAEGCGDWAYGEALIHADHFTEYAEELLKDIGALPQDLPGYVVIDWEATANNLLVDYTAIQAGRETYYLRT